MDIISLLGKRTEYGFDRREKDLFLEEIVKSREEEIAIVTTENGLRVHGQDAENIICLLENYKLKGMFSLRNPYANTNIDVFLYVFSKKCNKDIMYGIYKRMIRGRCSKEGVLELRSEYPEDYYDYLDSVEKFVESGECPKDGDNQEFGFVPRNEWNEERWNPNRFNKAAVGIRNKIKKEKTVPLSEVADIIRPRPDAERRHVNTCFSVPAWQYPIDYTKLREGALTDTVIQKGDIVFITVDRMYLVDAVPEQELHVSPNAYVIRPKGICPEYLYLYLRSETAQIIMDSLSMGAVIRRITRRDMENIRVIIPKKDDEYYIQAFRVENYPVNNIVQFNSAIQNLDVDKKKKDIEDILDAELVTNLKTYKSDVMEAFLTEDLNELNVCFRYKAYKAALILAGSILEAVLIDWLSEIDGKNYFEETYYSRRDGKEGTLAIYIRDIKYIKRPNWMVEADKAYAIKDNRNKVHAKLCIKANDINEDLCRQVVGYLEDVLKTRRGKMVKR